ncbi:MAG: hypothetical protein IH941_01900 [Acidobacteria bacterium]|nr:hypothetical protein [Acidobacteriota bacterium]
MARPLDAPPTPPIRRGRSWIPIGDITYAFSSVFTAVLIALVAAFALVRTRGNGWPHPMA